MSGGQVTTELRSEPFSLKLIKSLGLLKPLINHLVIRRQRSSYKFPRRYLKFLESPTSNVPVLYFSKAHPPSSTVLIYSHGNSSNLNNIYSFAKHIHEKYGIAVVAYDYTGYGESSKSDINFQGDIKTVLSWVLDLGYQINRVVLAGFSLGTYSTLMLKGLMPRLLIAPISGIIPFLEGEIAQYKGQIFDNVKAAQNLKDSRVMMVHSHADTVSINHSRLIYRAMTKGLQPTDFPNIKFIEMYNITHDETPEIFIHDMNKQFSQFLSQVMKDAKLPKKCSQTNKLVEQLAQWQEKVKTYQQDQQRTK